MIFDDSGDLKNQKMKDDVDLLIFSKCKILKLTSLKMRRI